MVENVRHLRHLFQMRSMDRWPSCSSPYGVPSEACFGEFYSFGGFVFCTVDFAVKTFPAEQDVGMCPGLKTGSRDGPCRLDSVSDGVQSVPFRNGLQGS